MDRRDFMALTGTALAATATSWSGAVMGSGPAPVSGRVRLGGATLDRLTQRLADLRVLDDELGGTALRDLGGARGAMAGHDAESVVREFDRMLAGVVVRVA